MQPGVLRLSSTCSIIQIEGYLWDTGRGKQFRKWRCTPGPRNRPAQTIVFVKRRQSPCFLLDNGRTGRSWRCAPHVSSSSSLWPLARRLAGRGISDLHDHCLCVRVPRSRAFTGKKKNNNNKEIKKIHQPSKAMPVGPEFGIRKDP